MMTNQQPRIDVVLYSFEKFVPLPDGIRGMRTWCIRNSGKDFFPTEVSKALAWCLPFCGLCQFFKTDP